MGNPLITDTFHADRWDYLYSIQPGGSQRQQERVSLVFNGNDQLAGLAGDFKPGVSRDEAILGTDQPAIETPVRTEPEATEPGSLLEQIQRDVDAAEPAPVPAPDPLETN
jgi:outer membrane protein assembly factor BamE